MKWRPGLTECYMRFLPIKPTSNMVSWLSLLWRPSFDLWALCRPIYIEMSVPIGRKEGRSHPLQKRIRGACWARLPLADRLSVTLRTQVHRVDLLLMTRAQRHHSDEDCSCRWHEKISKLTSYQRLESLSTASLRLIPQGSCRVTTRMITRYSNRIFGRTSEFCMWTCLIWRNFSRTCSHSFLVLRRVLLW